MKRIYPTLFIAIMVAGLFMMGCGAPPDITGTWESDCEQDATTGFYAEYFLDYADTTRDAGIAYYAAPGCLGPLFDIDSSVDYVFGAETAVADVWEIDYTWDSMGITVLNQGMVDGFNGAAMCGKTDWALDTRVSLLGLTCDFGFPVPSAGDESLNVVHVVSDGVSLYHGDMGVPGSGVRETTLGSVLYTLQP